MATGPDLRIGDADREQAAASLREHFAQGRLSLEEFNERLDTVFTATTQGQLRRVTSDLPHVAAPAAPRPVTTRHIPQDDAGRGYSQSRPRLRLLTAVAAVLLTWLVFASLLIPELRGFPAVGRFAILLLIFGLVRGLFRRIVDAGRGGYSRRGCGCRHSSWGGQDSSWR